MLLSREAMNIALWTLAAVALASQGAAACPDCDAGRLAWALAWNDGALAAAATSIPFVLVAAVCVVAEVLWRRRSGT